MNLQKNIYLNLVEGENLIPYKCIYADNKKIAFATLTFEVNEKDEPIEVGVDETKKIEFLI